MQLNAKRPKPCRSCHHLGAFPRGPSAGLDTRVMRLLLSLVPPELAGDYGPCSVSDSERSARENQIILEVSLTV